MPPERIGPYRIEDRLGAGGMGEVYKAYDERLDRWVALKRVSPDKSLDANSRERLRREARASARLNHPAIVQIYDLVQTGEADCIIMELVEGRLLSRVLREGPLGLGRALALAREIAEALAEAHAHGIVHRDLKAENVIVTPGGHAKVLDFGISKRLGDGEEEHPLTAEGAVLGTFRAMAPEQARGLKVDHRADLFSFGIILYEMLTAHSPFADASAAVMLHRVCSERHESVRELDPLIPAGLSHLIDRLLEKKPELRPQTAREVEDALAALAAGQEPALPRSSGSLAAEMPTQLDMRPDWQTGDSRGEVPSAERRQVTVLSCGLVRPDGEPVDSEEVFQEMPALWAAMAEVVQRFEGRMARTGRHDCLAYFGDIYAHEDDALRAVHTALEIVARTARPAAGPGSPGFAVRVGIHTGSMVIARGTAASSGNLALGEAPDVAAWLQGTAGPQGVLVSQGTLRLIQGFFDCEALPPLQLPGGGRTVLAYRVISHKGAHTRVEVSGSLTPLIGREQELGMLLERWSLALEGRGQVVLLSGEAGIGKSRLVRELEQLVAGSARWAVGHGSPFHRDSALYPILQWLDQLTGCQPGDAPERRLERLEKTVARYGLPVPEILAPLAALLSLPLDEWHSVPLMRSDQQRRRAFEALLSLLLAAAERNPLLLVVEDLHWADPSTLELLGLLIGQAAAASLLLVLTFRTEFEPPWEQRGAMTHLTPGLLTRSQAGLMVEGLAAGQAISAALRDQIVARTDGVPLFVEEMTRMVLDSDTAQENLGNAAGGPSRDIPGTLAGWLMTRLDRLGPAKDVAQFASVLGREPVHELLCAAAPWSEAVLQRELDRLVEAELLYRRGFPPRLRYLFKHALLQEAAYASLLHSDRKRHHRRIAETLEASFPELVARQPELVAHHYAEADLPEPALAFWRQAGENAIRSSAFREAIAHLEKALALLADLPESRRRDEQEIALRLNLGVAKSAVQSTASPEVRSNYSRAWELCQNGEPTAQLFPVLRGLYIFHVVSGQSLTGLEMARQLLDVAERDGSPALRIVGHQALGFSLLTTGSLVQAREHLEEVMDLYAAGVAGVEVFLPAGGAPVESLSNLTWVLWFLGYPDQALRRRHEGLELARRLSAPYSLCYTEFFAAELHAFRGEPAETLPLAEEIVAIAAEHGYPLPASLGAFLRGWATAELKDPEAGLAQMREGMEARLATGALTGTVSQLALLAAHCLRMDRLEEALAEVERAFAISAQGGHTLMDAELHRLKGELLHRRGAPEDEAEAELRRALEIARAQSARSLELRAAMSLARLHARSGRNAEARAILAPVYEWFTEGLGTRDLQEARSLLADLPAAGARPA